MAKEYQDDEILRRIYGKAEIVATRNIMRSIQKTRSQYAAEVERLATTGDYAAIYALADRFADQIGRAVAAEYERAFMQAANEITVGLGKGLDIQVSFSGSNPRAAQFLAERSATLISEISANQRAAIRLVLDDAFARGTNPIKTAREIVQHIGLTQRQAQAVSNYRRLLERGSAEALDRALRDPQFDTQVRLGDLDSRTIDRMVAGYRRNYVRFRAETIARTEMLAATSAGAHEAYTQAIESGDLDGFEYVREWWTARDERVRGSHRAMHGQVRRHNDKFISGAGNLLQYPHDPAAPLSETIQCRCRAVTRFRAALEYERDNLLQV